MASSRLITKIKRKSNDIIEMYTADNNAYFEFKIKSIIIQIPNIVSNKSPIIFIESDTIELSKSAFKEKYVFEHNGIKSITHYLNIENSSFVYEDEIDDDDDEFEYEKYNNHVRLFTKGIFCFLNIQGLEYNRNYAELVKKLYSISGKKLEIELRKAVIE